MKINILRSLLILLFNGSFCFSQDAVVFEQDFQRLSESGFDSSEVSRILKKYDSFITPFTDSRRVRGAHGSDMVSERFPLKRMLVNRSYQTRVDDLLESSNSVNRVLGYSLVVSAGDTSKINRLAEKLSIEEHESASLYLGLGLIYLGYQDTSELFKWVMKAKAEVRSILYPMLGSFPKEQLRHTAMRFVASDDWDEKIFAIQLFMNTGFTVETDSVIRKAITEWPASAKGYAIVPAQNLQIGDLLALLHPLLADRITRNVSLTALADSPTQRDRAFVSDMAISGSLDKDILGSLKQSRYPETKRIWLDLLRSDKLPDDYHFSVYSDTLLASDAMLPDLCSSMVLIKKPNILARLIPALKGRRDNESEQLLLGFIIHENDDVREQASIALEGNCTDLLKEQLIMVFQNQNYCVPGSFKLAIDCGMDSLQRYAMAIYTSEVSYLARISALNYAAIYPTGIFLPVFRKLLANTNPNSGMECRIAAKGLANLNDTVSVKDIIKACELERQQSDWNALEYIKALERFKGEKVRAYIRSFLESKDEDVKKLAEDILNRW